MNEVTMFNFESHEVRTVLIDNEPWFVGKDVADTLGYSAARNALKNHVADEDKLTHRISASGQSREMVMINESGVYSLIFGSKLDSAKRFKKWVTSEVLPSIRKTGAYAVKQVTDPMQMLALQYEALKQVDSKQNVFEKRLDDFEDAQEIRSWEQQELLTLRRNRVFGILGGKYSRSYKELSSEVFQAISKDFKRQFNVPRYNALPRKRFDDAKKFFNNWEPNNLLELAIRGVGKETV